MNIGTSTTLAFLGAVAFVAFWSASGWLAGRFFGRVRRLQQTNEWRGKWSLETDRLVTLAALFVLVLCASTIDGQVSVPENAKAGAFVATLACLIVAYRTAVSSRSDGT